MTDTLILEDVPATLPYSFARRNGVLLRARTGRARMRPPRRRRA
jgi:hypothetical protein